MLNFISSKKKYCVFDIGTDKVICLLFKIDNGKPIILGMGHQKSIGFSQNYLSSEKNLSRTIIKSLKKSLPKNSHFKNYVCYSNITDINSLTKKNFTSSTSGRLGITKKDIRKVFKKSIIESKVKGKNLIHSYPMNFRIDDNKLTHNPIGEKCENFGITSFNIMVDKKLYEKFNKCFRNENIQIKQFFDTGIASSISNLSKEEKEKGAACIDIGATSSKVTVYINDKIIYSKNIPLGGEHVTNDISKGLDISLESAEHAKIVHGTLNMSFDEQIEINSYKSKNKKISKNILYGIIKPRYEEIFEIIRDYIFDDIYARVSIKSIVVTGGASKIFGLLNLTESIFNRRARLGTVLNKKSFFYNKPEFSTILGLIKLSQDNKNIQISNEIQKRNFLSKLDRLENWIEESYA